MYLELRVILCKGKDKEGMYKVLQGIFENLDQFLELKLLGQEYCSKLACIRIAWMEVGEFWGSMVWMNKVGEFWGWILHV